jgi:hypothetical protein
MMLNSGIVKMISADTHFDVIEEVNREILLICAKKANYIYLPPSCQYHAI